MAIRENRHQSGGGGGATKDLSNANDKKSRNKTSRLCYKQPVGWVGETGFLGTKSVRTKKESTGGDSSTKHGTHSPTTP